MWREAKTEVMCNVSLVLANQVPLGGGSICVGDAAQEGSHFLQRWTGRFKQTEHFEHCNKTRVIKLFVEILAKRKSWTRLYRRLCNYNCAAQLFGRTLLLSRWSHTEVTPPKSLIGYRPVALTSPGTLLHMIFPQLLIFLLLLIVSNHFFCGETEGHSPLLVVDWYAGS